MASSPPEGGVSTNSVAADKAGTTKDASLNQADRYASILHDCCRWVLKHPESSTSEQVVADRLIDFLNSDGPDRLVSTEAVPEVIEELAGEVERLNEMEFEKTGKEDLEDLVVGVRAIDLALSDQNKAVTFAAIAKKEITVEKMSWADICDVESDDEEGLFKEMLDIAIEKDSNERVRDDQVILPGGLDHMPRWHEILKRACKVCKLDISYSKKTTIASVINQGLYSTDPREWATAKEGAVNDKNVFAAYNTVNHIIQFFARPIDLDKMNNPSHGQLWILYKIALLWHRTAFGNEFDLDKFKTGTACGELRPILTGKLRSLIPRDGDACAELLMSALDRIVFAYIQKIYKSKRGQSSSDYVMKAIKTVSRYGSKWTSLLARKQTKVVTSSTGKGKNKVVKEEKKTSFYNPSVPKSDLFTGKEDSARNEFNIAVAAIPDLLNQEDFGPQLNTVVATSVMNVAWRVHDEFGSLVKMRRNLVRTDVMTKRPDDRKQEKILPSEWILSQASVKKLVTDDDINEIYEKFQIVITKDLPNSEDWTNLFDGAINSAVNMYGGFQLDWDLFDKNANDPSVFHKKLVALNKEATSTESESKAPARTYSSGLINHPTEKSD
jgi:hypothetical protein